MISSSETSRTSASNFCFRKRFVPSAVCCVSKHMKFTRFQQYIQFSFKLFLIINFDKIHPLNDCQFRALNYKTQE